MLYNDAKSCLCINGHRSETFRIEKSVRQGCPLSMVLFVIFQEPFYRMLKAKTSKFGLRLPNGLLISVFGYADDTSVIVSNDKGIVECYKIIKKYENATGARLNLGKTSILGAGKWKDRVCWAISGINA